MNAHIPQNDPILPQVLAAWDYPAQLLGAVRYGQGHINDTYCLVCQPQEGDPIRFILQGLSIAAFPHPEELMENFVGITSWLRAKVQDPLRETLSLVQTRDGRDFYTDETGKVWRLMPFIEGTDCHQKATPELFEASARAFGRFQRLLEGYPAETLHEPIPNFHNTEDRFEKLESAVKADRLGRAKEVVPEIQFVLDRRADCSVAMDALRTGRLPLRVTHNDTKLNNILIDRQTHEEICVIDLDTTMPGLVIYDFGDSIRFGANHCAEDEKDLNKVRFDIGLYEVYTRGFLQGAGGSLTPEELRYLPWGARLMTLECGIRFLTDYLEGGPLLPDPLPGTKPGPLPDPVQAGPGHGGAIRPDARGGAKIRQMIPWDRSTGRSHIFSELDPDVHFRNTLVIIIWYVEKNQTFRRQLTAAWTGVNWYKREKRESCG